MCGVVGYIGSKPAQNILVSGLKRLEYRGYDSAGIATLGKTVTLTKAKGRVTQLEKLLRPNPDVVGIGHTRWATHGEPSERNSHPHMAGDIILVHNGIIENYVELKELLGSKYNFNSDTDSEVLAALIDSFYQNNAKQDLLSATLEALKLVVGTYGIALVSRTNHNQIVVARNGSPLLVGLGDHEVFIASDSAALVGFTDQIIYLNDGEIGLCTKDGIDLKNLAAEPVDKKIDKLEMDLETIQKKGFKHFLLKEIHDQPNTLRSTLSGRINPKDNTIKLGGPNLSQEELANIKHILIVGCGTANYAGQLASYYLEQFMQEVTVQVEIASELRYKSFNLPSNTVALIVSQSGETADTLACLNELKRRGVSCLGIVNAVGSTIARECGRGIYVHVGAEISVASTKAFTSQVAAMIMFGLTVAEAKGNSSEKLASIVNELNLLPSEIEKVIKDSEQKIGALAQKYYKYEHALYLGRDTFYPIALEGALKLKEISYIQAEGYAAGELKHGPIALVDDNFFEVMYLSNNRLIDKTMSNLAEINSRGGHVLVITNSSRKINSESLLKINTKLNLLAPLVFNVAGQLLAYHIALDRGLDIDRPRNLAKSVTVE